MKFFKKKKENIEKEKVINKMLKRDNNNLKRRLYLLDKLCEICEIGCCLYLTNDDFYNAVNIHLEDFKNIIAGISLDEYEKKISFLSRDLKNYQNKMED